MATVIGTVTKISGMAIVVDANGNRHMLKKGEALHAGDKLITASGATVLVKLANGETVNFAESQTVKITQNLAQADNVDVTENAVDQAIFDAVLTALNEGRDITEVLQVPAAGVAGSDGNATFVNLDRIQTANAALSNYDSNGDAGSGDGQNGFRANYVYFQTASDAPLVELLGDANGDGYLNANELNGLNTTTARISLVGVEAGDTVNVTHNGGTISVVVTASDVAKGNVDVEIPVPAEGSTLLVTATVTNQSGQTSPSGSDSAIIDKTSPDAASISGQLPETKVDDTGISQTDNITSNKEPTLTGTTEKSTDTVVVTLDGKEYIATVTDDGTGKGVWSVALTGANLSDGAYTPSITVTDLAGNTTTKSSETFTVDATAPDSASISGQLPETKVDDTGVSQTDNITSNKAPTLTGTTEKATDTVVVTINGVDYTATVTDDGTGKGVWSVALTGTNLSDGAYTPTITVTDVAGNTTTKASETFTVDTTAPNSPEFVGMDDIGTITGQIVNNSTIDDDKPEIKGTGATPGDTITIYDGDEVLGTALVDDNGNWTFTPTTALSEGEHVITTKATDPAGNTSPASSPLTFTVDATAPATAISIDATIADDGVVNLAESQSSNVLVTGTVGGDAKLGDTVTVTVNGKEYTTTVITRADSKLGFSVAVAGSDLVADSDKIVNAKITLTDIAGNSSTATDTQDYAVNTQGPAVSISLDATVAGDGVVNAAEATSAKVAVTGTVNGEFNVGDIVTVTVNGVAYTTTVLAGGEFSVDVKGSDLVADADKVIEAKVTTTDQFGNSTTATDTQDYAVNTQGPAVSISLDATVAGDGVVNAAEATSAKVAVTGTVNGEFNVGDIVTVTVNGVAYTTTVLAGGEFSVDVKGSDLVADADKVIEAKVTTTDQFGNSTTATDTQDYAVNTQGPAVSISLDATVAGDGVVNAAEATSAKVAVTGTVNGEFNVGDIVTVTVNGVAYTTTVLAGGEFSVDVKGSDLVADADKVIEAKVTTTDQFGNSTTATDTQDYAVNTQGPAVSISLDATVAGDGVVNAAEATSAKVAVTGTVNGEFNVGDIVTVTVNGVAYTTTVLAGGEFSVDVKGSDLVADADKVIEAKVTTTDQFGNSTTATDTQDYAVNTQGPAVSISLDATVAGDGVVNAAEATSAKVAVTGTVNGEFNVGDIVTVTVNGVAYTTTVLAGGEFSVDVKGSDLVADADKVIEAKVTTTDQFGNSTTATDTQDYAVNTQGPAVSISLDATVAGDGVVNAAEATSAKVAVTGTVNGEFNVGDIVTVTVNGVAYTTTVLAGGEFSVDVKGSDLVADADKVIEAKVTTTDQFGNSTTATDTQDYAVNTQGPAVSISLDATVAGDGVVNAAEATSAKVAVTGTVNGEFNVGDIVTVTVNGVAYTTTVLAGGEFSVDVKGSDLVADADKVIEAKVTTTDQFGNSTTATDTQDYKVYTNTTLSATIALDANFGNDKDGIVNIAETQAGVKVPVSGTVGGDAKEGDVVVVTVNNVVYTTTVTKDSTGKLVFTVDVLGTDLKADSDATIDAKVTVKDAAGNTSTAVTSLTYAIDLTPPSATIALDANFGTDKDGIVNIAETQAGVKVPVSGTVGGDAKEGDVVVVTVNNVVYTTTVTKDSTGKLVFTVDVLGTDLKADSDATIDAKVTVKDAAGNTSTAVTSLTYAIDLTPPSATIALDANFGTDKDGIVNIAETQAGVKVPVSGTVGGDAKEGDVVVVTVNNVVYTTTVTKDSTGKLVFTVDVLGTDLKADSDATIDAKVTVKDAAGNTSTAVTSLTYAIDLTPPSATIALDANFGTDKDGIVNIAETQAGVKVPVSGTVGGDAKEGDVVVVTVNNVVYTTTVTKDSTGKLVFTVDVLGTDLKADSDATIDAKVTVKDAAGNTSTAVTSLTYAIDLTPPSATIALDANFGTDKDGIVNIAETQAGVKVPVSGTVGGDAKEGDVVVVTVNNVVYTTTVTKDSTGKLVFTVDVLGTDLKADSDATIDAKVTVKDAAGNTSTAVTSLTYAIDLTPPSATIALDANFGTDKDGIVNIAETQAGVKVPVSGTVGGDAKEGDVVVVTVNNVVYTTTVTKDSTGKLVFTVDVLGTDLKADSDATIDAKVTVEDAAGNTSTAVTSLTYAIDLTPPSATIALDANFGTDKDGIVNIAETQAGVKVPVSGTVGGDAKEGDVVVVTVNNVVYTTTVTKDSTGKLVFTVDVLGTDLKADSDATIDAKVTVKDAAGNTSTAVTSLTYALDLVAPTKPTIDKVTDDFGSTKGDLTSGSTADDATPTLSGKAEAGSTVTIYDGTKEIGTTKADANGNWTFTPSTDISNGLHNYTVTATDKAGNSSVSSDNFAYTLSTVPAPVHDDSVTGPIVFQAYNPKTGNEVWVTDGTTGGTKLLCDIIAGGWSGILGFTQEWTRAEFFDMGNGMVLFQAYTAKNGIELWVTDGTTEGTYLLKDINTGAASSYTALDGYTSLGNGKYLFTAYTEETGRELWVTDGTTAGTYMVKDIYSGVGSSFLGTSGSDSDSTSQYVGADFTSIGDGKAIFQAYNPKTGIEIWITDGTASGTYLLKDINTGVGSSYANDFTLLGNGLVVFTAYTTTNGYELWVTDGTTAGTTLLKDIYSSVGSVSTTSYSSTPTSITETIDGKALFWARNYENGQELWITDGTAKGTYLLKDINAGVVSSRIYNSDDITSLGNGKYLFSAYTEENGIELWVTDLTTGGTHLLKDVNAGAGSSILYSSAVSSANVTTDAYSITQIKSGWALFTAYNAKTGAELWITDGENAWLVSNINSKYDGYSSFVSSITATGSGNAIFTAYSISDSSEPYVFNFATWKTLHDQGVDTSSSVSLLSDINPCGPSYAQDYTLIGGGNEDTAYYLTSARLLSGWTDPTDGTLSVSGVTVDHGTVTKTADGRWKITPEDDYNGEIEISYNVVSTSGAQTATTLDLTIDAETDVFKFTIADNGTAGNPNVETITNFDTASRAEEGDVLNIRDLLVGESTSNLENYLHFETSGDDTIIHISSSGGFTNGTYSASKETAQIVLSGVDLLDGQASDAAIISNLIAQNKLITD